MVCTDCGSDETEVYPAEDEDEQAVLHCYNCGWDEQL